MNGSKNLNRKKLIESSEFILKSEMTSIHFFNFL